jgi:molybdopterin-guanine dinucleotide biosynthesis protein A
LTHPAVAGVFVGGAARRMEGMPKGLLLASDGRTLVEHTSSMLLEAGASEVVLVGRSTAYEHLRADAR